MAKPHSYDYGSPKPRTWQQTAEIIKANSPKKVTPRAEQPKPASK